MVVDSSLGGSWPLKTLPLPLRVALAMFEKYYQLDFRALKTYIRSPVGPSVRVIHITLSD